MGGGSCSVYCRNAHCRNAPAGPHAVQKKKKKKSSRPLRTSLRTWSRSAPGHLGLAPSAAGEAACMPAGADMSSPRAWRRAARLSSHLTAARSGSSSSSGSDEVEESDACGVFARCAPSVVGVLVREPPHGGALVALLGLSQRGAEDGESKRRADAQKRRRADAQMRRRAATRWQTPQTRVRRGCGGRCSRAANPQHTNEGSERDARCVPTSRWKGVDDAASFP